MEDLEELKKFLSKIATVEVIKEGVVFTLLMTGKGLTAWKNIEKIQEVVMIYANEKYGKIEVLKNDDNFLLMVLKP